MAAIKFQNSASKWCSQIGVKEKPLIFYIRDMGTIIPVSIDNVYCVDIMGTSI